MVEARDILLQRGNTPRVYRNMLIFLAAEARQLDNLKDAMRASLAWGEIVRDTRRLNLTQSDSSLAEAKLAEAKETVKTRLKEAWCYLLYPHQESAQADVEWASSKVPAQDGLLARASTKLVSDQGIWPELGPDNLNRQLEKYIWNDNHHLSLKEIWEYLNRYTYLPRLKNREVLAKAVQTAISGMVAGSFSYAERWDEKSKNYIGLAIEGAMNVSVVIDNDSLIVRSDIAEKFRPEPTGAGKGDGQGEKTPEGTPVPGGVGGKQTDDGAKTEKLPTRFQGTVMISSDRPALDMRQVVEAIIEQLTTISGATVELKLEIDAEVPGGIDKAKSRTLLENASTLGFIDKALD
jgi:predicted nucleic acid-binding protein